MTYRDLLATRRGPVEPCVRQPRAGVRGNLDLDDRVIDRRPRGRLVVHVDRAGAVVPLVHRDADALAFRAHPLERVVHALPPLSPGLRRRRELPCCLRPVEGPQRRAHLPVRCQVGIGFLDDLRAHRLALRRVCLEQARACQALFHERDLPGEVVRVLDGPR